MAKALGFVNGYLSAYNAWAENGIKNILGSMSPNDAYRWLVSWCRDMPSTRVDDGLFALVTKLSKE
jgi:hypothetical protein